MSRGGERDGGRMTTPPVSDTAAPGKAARPRPSASLVLLRPAPGDGARAGALQVLMGRRPNTAHFMPGVHVFPGGGLEPGDTTDADAMLGEAPAPPQLTRALTRPEEALPLLWAALRETWEETGVLIGRAPPEAPVPEPPAGLSARAAYERAGLVPTGTAHYIARAITPAASPIRFDTRFFLAFAKTAHGTPRASGELPTVEWMTVEAALTSETVRGVSKFVLREALALAADPTRLTDSDRPVHCFTYVDGELVITDE